VSGGGKGGDITVGYRYFLGMHMALCHGPIDNINKIEVDGRIAWEGVSTGQSIMVDAKNLFGGDKREGGVSGVVDIEFGKADQQPNDYLSSVLPGANPAYRGVACAVLRQCYMGNNPYLKPWAFTAQRVRVTGDGGEQWYVERANLGREVQYSVPTYFQYLTTSNPVLEEQPAPFGPVNPDSDFVVTEISTGAAIDYTWQTTDTLNTVFSVSTDITVNDCIGNIKRIIGWKGDRSGTSYALTTAPFNGSGFIDVVYIGSSLTPGSNSLILMNVPTRISYTRTGDPTPQTYQENARFRFDQVSTADGLKIILKLLTPVEGFTNVTIADLGVAGSAPFRLNEPVQITASLTAGKISAIVFAPNYYRVYTSYSYSIKIRNMIGEVIFSNGGNINGGTSSGWFDYGAGGLASQSILPDSGFFRSTYFSGGNRIDFLYLGAGYDGTEEFTSNYFECLDCGDMNPAHIIRECLTQSWGLGYQDADIDDTAFTAVANALFSEGMGLSILWDREVPIEDFISEILRHIDAVLYVSRETGKFVLKLIRDDYDVGSLLTLDETNSRMASDARRPTIGELVTSVTVNFTDSEQDEEDGSVTVHNEALIQLQGSVNNATADYPGFMTRSLASRIALRDLKSLSTPLLSCDVEANRDAAELNIGDVFILDYPEQGIFDVVMRIESMSVGDGKNNTVKISCVEDSFSVPDFDIVGDPGPGWVDPVNGTPLESQPRLMIESPYYELVQRVGDREAGLILDDDPDAGFIHANGGRQGGELNADFLVDSGAGFVDSGVLDFAPYAYLSADAWYSDSKLYYTNGKDLDLVSFPALAQVGDEIIRVDSLGVDSSGAHFNVGRGVLDTVPAEHVVDSNGTAIVFFDPTTDNLQYTASDAVNIKLLTALGSQRLTEAAAPADTINLDSRAIRPYPPGNLEIDFESYPRDKVWDGMHTLTWAHRDRLQQTSGTIFDYTEGNIGPEAGTTYKVTADAILTGGTISGDFIEVDVGSATDWEQDSNTDSNVGPPPVDADYIRFKVTSYRDGYASWQPAMVVIPYPEPIDSIGIDSIGIDSAPDSGSSTLWTPAEITTELWLDADDDTTVTEVSGAVSEWSDKSGNGFVFDQATAGNRPLYSATINSLSALTFDGSNDRLSYDATAGGSPFPSGNGQYSVFIVARPHVVTSNRAMLAGGAFGTTNQAYLFRVQNNGQLNDGWWANNLATGNSAVAANTPFLSAFTYDGSGRETFVNGTSEATDAQTSKNTGNGFDLIGAGGNAPTSGGVDSFFDGEICEIIIVAGSPDTTTRQLIEGYLAWKWGLEANLPSGHPYEFGPPTL
jgi:hypothetical protein